MYNNLPVAHNVIMQYKKLIAGVLASCSIVIASYSAFASAQADEKELYLGGFPAGFVLNTTVVQVVGVCEVATDYGMRSPARECGIKAGDVILKINDYEIKCSEDVNRYVEEDFKKIDITIKRNDETLTMPIQPVIEASTNKKRIGLLVKDSMNGIGTVTYIDKKQGKFASLGHPVTNANGNLIEINGGKLHDCVIYGVKRGVRGKPGELKGLFETSACIGTVTLNSKCGVFGNVSNYFDKSKLVSISTASLAEVSPGKACIYTTIEGDKPQKYDISIVKVDQNNKELRNFVIKIDSEELIEKTGGIVQGMSGSPIVQNGKLVGAVTHVFINDPTRGFGIGIDYMLKNTYAHS